MNRLSSFIDDAKDWVTGAADTVENAVDNYGSAIYDLSQMPGALDKLKDYPVTQSSALAQVGTNIYKYAARKAAGIDVSPIVQYAKSSAAELEAEEKRLKKYSFAIGAGVAAFLIFEGWVHYRAFKK